MTTSIAEPRVPLEKLARDIRKAAATLSDTEARFLVDYYYIQQENRKRSDHQVRLLAQGTEPNEVVQWLARNDLAFEKEIVKGLQEYVDAHLVGRWADSIHGIGPVIAAGLLAHIDITKAPTAGHIWRFAGLDPTDAWDKGQKRPWNAKLKTLCWKLGESFVKVQNSDKDFYGHLMLQYKERITAKNEAGEYAGAAAAKLVKFKIGKDTEAYGYYIAGKLPPAHIHSRAKRWAVKLFLAHLHHVWFEVEYGTPPPKPYILTPQGGHSDYIVPPNWPMT